MKRETAHKPFCVYCLSISFAGSASDVIASEKVFGLHLSGRNGLPRGRRPAGSLRPGESAETPPARFAGGGPPGVPGQSESLDNPPGVPGWSPWTIRLESLAGVPGQSARALECRVPGERGGPGTPWTAIWPPRPAESPPESPAVPGRRARPVRVSPSPLVNELRAH